MLDSTMTNIISPSGGGGVKSGGETDTTFTSGAPAKPGLSGLNAINDRNRAPFDKPRASGGVPVKFFEDISVSPEPLETTLENTGLIR